MEKELLENALKLSKEVRANLNDLTKLWSLRFFEDLRSASELTRITGLSIDSLRTKMELLEHYIWKEDLISISKEEWPIYDLVNYYDYLIAQIQKKKQSTRIDEGRLKSIIEWRNTAGRFAQIVCHLEDAN